jgi:eukaryotic-like serine/threonine-protein kinase
MNHPSIAKVFDAGATSEGQPYFVMEYVSGIPITDYCDQNKLKIRDRLELFMKVCEGVQHAHQKAIIHRDLKPANILVLEIDGRPIPRIIDFGLAKATNAGIAAESLHTRLGSFVGTPGYMSPEQCDPTSQDVDTRTDVYSLGVILYVLLAGSLPFDSKEWKNKPFDEMLRRLREEDPPRPSTKVSMDLDTAEARGTEPQQLLTVLRGDLDWITLKAVEKDRTRRYETPSDLAADIRLRNEPITARRASFSYRARKFILRNHTPVALVALVLVAVVAGIAGTLIQARTARAQRDFAYRQLSRAEAVNELNNFLLSDAAPSGKPFTVDELLGRAERIITRQQTADANQVELLVSIGRAFATEDESARAQPLLERAYRLSRTMSDPSTRSKASCAMASLLADIGELPRAEALLQEGLNELPDAPQYTLDREFCLLRGAEIAGHRGDANDEIARVQAAQDLLDSSVFRSDLGDLHIFIDLAEAYRNAVQFREAIAAFEQAARLENSLGRQDTENAGTLYNNWALALYQIGRPLDAEPLFRRAIDISRADNTEQAVSPMLLLNYGRTLRELGRFDKAADYAERALTSADKLGQQVVVNQSLIERARIYRDMGDLHRALTMLAEVEPRLQRALPRGHYAFAGIASERSLIALAQGDLNNALKLANDAVAIDEAAIKSGGQGAAQLPIFLVRRSTDELAAGHPDDAAASAARALSLLQAATPAGTFSCNLGRAYLALGRALESQGKRQEAGAAFQSAVEHLQNALGADHADTRSAQQLAAEVASLH